AGALLDRAEHELGQREFQEAAECLATVKQMSLDDARIIARLERANGQIEQSRNAVRLLDAAREDLQRENLTEAFRAVSGVLAADPGNGTGQRLLQEIQARMTSREARRRIQEEISRVESLLLIGETDQALALLADIGSREPSLGELPALRARAEAQKAEQDRARRLTEGVVAVRALLKNRQFDDALGGIDELLGEFAGNPELLALRRHAAEQVAARKRAEEIRNLKAEAAARIGRGEHDNAIRALEAGIARLGDDGDLTRLLQSALAGKAAQERERAVSRIVEESQQLRRQGKLDDALRAIERAIQRWGGEPPLPRLLQEVSDERREKDRLLRIREVVRRANALMDQKKPDAAIVLLRQSIEQDGEQPELRTLLDSAEAQVRDRSRSVRVNALREEVSKLVNERRWEQAYHRIDDGLKESPDDPWLVSERAAVLAAVAGENRERAILEALERIHSLERQSRFPEAAEVLERSLVDYGGDARLLDIRQRLSDGLADRQRAEYLANLRNECVLLLNQRRFNDAIRLLEGGEVRYPGSREVSDLLAQARSARDAYERKESVEKALARAAVLVQQGDFESAIAALEEALRSYPDSRELAEALARAGTRREAHERKESIEKALARASVLVQQGDFESAIAALEEALRSYSDSRDLAEALARARTRREAHQRKQSIEKALARASVLVPQGDFESAIAALEETLRSYPDSRELAEALARAGTRRDEADRQREIKQIVEVIERALAAADWSRAIDRISAGLDRFPGEPSLVRLKRTAEDGKHRAEIAEVESSALRALQSGNSALAAEIVSAARIRWPNEKKLLGLHREVELSRADEEVSRARQLLQSGQYDEAERLAADALRRCPKLASATDLLEEIKARRSARAEAEKLKTAVAPVAPRKRRPWLAVLGAAAVVAMGGALYWVVRPHPKPAPEEAKAVAPEVNDLKIGESTGSPQAQVGTAYAQTLRTSGGSSPVSWVVTRGALPNGLSLDRQTGRIEGTPAARGTFTFVAQASDSRGHTAQRTFTLTVVEPHKEKSPASQPEVASAKPAVPPKPAAPESKRDQPDTVSPGPTAKAAVPPPCKAREFVLSEYGDSRSGELTWTGSLSGGGELEIRNRHASTGFARGDILPPGVPVRVSVSPDTVRIVTAPSANNCWDSRLLLQNGGPPATAIKIEWVVYQP
ncbi:MAG TPA: tetratricopeptide repeat protein, partial [Bryobacteraceae bacterium]|nr:tetratricopeptide repeat protein [Bryobacteraceae bacterium]